MPTTTYLDDVDIDSNAFNTSNVTLDVGSKYTLLVKESLQANSVYTHIKNTIDDLVTEGAISEASKAQILSSVLGVAVSGITSSSMATALEWTAKEKELSYKEAELRLRLTELTSDIEVKKEQIRLAKLNNIKVQMEGRSIYGVPTVDNNGIVTAIDDSGKVHYEIEKTKEEVKQVKASTHKIVADAVTNYGIWAYTFDTTSDGLTLATRATAPGVSPLSDYQRYISSEQAKGYAYNAWANAVNATSSVIGTALAANSNIFKPNDDGSVSIGQNILVSLDTALNRLKSVEAPSMSTVTTEQK